MEMEEPMKGKKRKGQYGYRDWHRKTQLCKVMFGAAMILIQLGARGFTDNEAAKNILTVMAVLSVLPTANVASPLLASWKYKTPSREFYDRVKGLEETGVVLYDLIVTSKEQIIPIDAVMLHPKGVFACCTDPKLDLKKAEGFLNDTFRARRLDPNVTLIRDEKAFFKRLESLRPWKEQEDDGSMGYGTDVLKGLSM